MGIQFECEALCKPWNGYVWDEQSIWESMLEISYHEINPVLVMGYLRIVWQIVEW